MRFAFLVLWISAALSSAVCLSSCSASHPPDACTETLMVDFDRRACVDSVDAEQDADVEPGQGGGRRGDGGARDARARDGGFDPELDGDGPCRLGSTRKCQCASGAYSDQSCQADRSWQACACDSRPPLVFGDGSITRDPGRRPDRPDGWRPGRDDAGAPDAAVDRDAHVDMPAPQLPYTPAQPTVPVPDCRAAAPAAAPARSSRWLAYRAAPKGGSAASLQLVELGEGGPTLPIEAGSIDSFGPLGAWSSDGAQFAFTMRATRNEVGAVQLVSVPAAGAVTPPTPPAFVLVAPSAGFDSWAPARPRLAVRTSDAAGSALKVFDTTAPVTERAALHVGTATVDHLSWSPDGRYLALSASDATGLSLWDLDAPMLTSSMVDTSGRSLRWSSDGKRFAYVHVTGSAALWSVAWDGSAPVKQQVSPNVSTFGMRVNEPLWLDAARVFWQEAGGELFVTDLSGPAPVTRPLGLQPAYFSVSPGGVCIAYSGPCSDNGQPGVCVRKLDPTGMPQPAHVSNLPWGGVVWSQTGDQLALSSPAGTVVEALNLDGQAFVPQLVSLGREGQFVLANMAWAPGAPARWLAYHVPGQRPTQKGLSLWSSAVKKSFPLELGDMSAQGFAWSPDGRDLVLQSYYPGGAAATPARLLLQRVADGGLGSQWIVVGPDLPEIDLAGDLFAFQP